MEPNQAFFATINDNLKQTKKLKLSELKGHSIIFIIDMVNGFCHQGKFASPNITTIISPIKQLVTKAITNQVKLIAFNDNHNEHSPEFASYPPHCLEGSVEANLVPELNFPEIKIIKKNSTNGFFAFDFKPNLQWDNIIIVGCCTDICVYQFALSCKAWFNQHNKVTDIIVPMSMTTTFDHANHPADQINNLGWYSMLKNGITIVKDIE